MTGVKSMISSGRSVGSVASDPFSSSTSSAASFEPRVLIPLLQTILILSPGMTISAPSGNFTTPTRKLYESRTGTVSISFGLDSGRALHMVTMTWAFHVGAVPDSPDVKRQSSAIPAFPSPNRWQALFHALLERRGCINHSMRLRLKRLVASMNQRLASVS